MSADLPEALQAHLDSWRTYALEHGWADQRAATVEAKLHEQAVALSGAGLDADEAFLVALRRVAASDVAIREFARVYAAGQYYAGGQWIDTSEVGADPGRSRGVAGDFWVMLACTVGAAIAVKVPAFFGVHLDGPNEEFYARNVSLLVLPFLGAYLVRSRRLAASGIAVLAGAFVVGALGANAFPFTPGGATETLTAIHMPIALWLVLGVAHSGGQWRSPERRMEFVRFTGEWLVSYALIALGGGVLMTLTLGVFESIGIDVSTFIVEWVLPCGAAGAVIVAGWLAAGRRNVAGGMAPVLARVFTPLFTVMLVALLAGVIRTRGSIAVEREVLLLLDLLLVVVLALLLYAISARGARVERGLFDWIQLVLVACALAVDAFALANITGRLAEYGLSANRIAVLGLNLILLVNLGWSAVLQLGFVRARHDLGRVERWHMRYLPAYALWAAVVAIVFPVLFAFA